MPLHFFYTMVQKFKNDQTLKSRGSCLNSSIAAPLSIEFGILAALQQMKE